MASGSIQFFMLPEEFGVWLHAGDENERFVLSRPRLDDGVLYMGFMGFKDPTPSDELPETQRAWRRVVRSLKRHLHSGMWVDNVAFGGKRFYRNIWISDAAAEFALHGGVLRDGLAANLVFTVTEPI